MIGDDGSMLPRRIATNLESEDSSYDSDHEGEADLEHDDISRTVSETLAAEFADYVNISDPAYGQKVEFALKLGYTETQVHVALHKLGPESGQNELLAELIKLGASTRSVEEIEGATSTVSTPGITVTASPDPTLPVQSLWGKSIDSENLRPIVIDGSNVAMR